MKKLIYLSLVAIAGFTACKKEDKAKSFLATYSTPTITISGDQYYSINVGGSLPDISATAYDSFYNESYTPVVDKSTLDNTTPGLYVVNITAKNKYGMVGSKGVYVAVTNIPDAIHLEGSYERLANGQPATIVRRARGLYETNNVAGVNPTTQSGFVTSALFAQIDDTTLVMPLQPTTLGTLYGTDGKIEMIVADTTIAYKVQGNSNFNATVTRVFQKL